MTSTPELAYWLDSISYYSGKGDYNKDTPPCTWCRGEAIFKCELTTSIEDLDDTEFMCEQCLINDITWLRVEVIKAQLKKTKKLKIHISVPEDHIPEIGVENTLDNS